VLSSAGILAGNAIGGRKVIQQWRAAGLKLTSPMALAITDQRLLGTPKAFAPSAPAMGDGDKARSPGKEPKEVN
jgi:hypothetical protein